MPGEKHQARRTHPCDKINCVRVTELVFPALAATIPLSTFLKMLKTQCTDCRLGPAPPCCAAGAGAWACAAAAGVGARCAVSRGCRSRAHRARAPRGRGRPMARPETKDRASSTDINRQALVQWFDKDALGRQPSGVAMRGARSTLIRLKSATGVEEFGWRLGGIEPKENHKRVKRESGLAGRAHGG